MARRVFAYTTASCLVDVCTVGRHFESYAQRREHARELLITKHQAVGLKHAITNCSLCIFKLDMSDLCLRLARISMGLI